MAEEGFLSRWSRLKRDRQAEEMPEPADDDEAVVDLASLPPLESLCRDSDYTAFLQRGVPETLRRLALRRAWVTDPAIADFRGCAEYDWDCNAPGYGALRATDNILDLCDSILRRVKDPEPAATVPDRPTQEQPPDLPDEPSSEPEVA